MLICLVAMMIPIGARAQWIQTNGPYAGYVRAFAMISTNLFAGTETGGVFRSTNSGTSWTQVNEGLTNTSAIALAAIGTTLYAGTYGGGVFVSTNNGTIWTEANSGLGNKSVQVLAVSGTNLFAGTDGGVFLSTNGGSGWTHLTNGLPNAIVYAFAVSGTNLFAGTANGGVFRSTDNGTSWTQAASGLPNANVYAFATSGTNLFAATLSGVFVSTNGGTGWTTTGLTSTDVEALAVSGTNLFAGTYGGGVFVSSNGGTSWATTALTGKIVRALAVTGTNLFAGTQGGVWTRLLADIVGPPAPPTALAGSFVSATSFTANWSPVPGATGYRLYLALDSTFTNYVSGYNNLDVGNVTSKAIMGLAQITPYWYRVRASNLNGTSGNSNSIKVTTQNPVVEVSLTVSDGVTGVQQLYFGLAPTASDGIDASLGEVELPPLPPNGVFDARLVGDDIGIDIGQGLLRDCRLGNASTVGQKMHELRYQVGTGTAITITWAFPAGVDARLQDIGGGSLIDVAMSGSGSYTVTNPGFISKLKMIVQYDLAHSTTGELRIFLLDAEGWGQPGTNAYVGLYDESGQFKGQQQADGSSHVAFSALPAGTGYRYAVNFQKASTPFGTQYWGERNGITIPSGTAVQDTFTRNMPVGITVNIYDNSTNMSVESKSVTPGTNLRIELEVKNPNSVGALQRTAKGLVIVDRDKAEPYDENEISTGSIYAVGQIRKTLFYFTPTAAGDYYLVGGVKTVVGGVDIITDGGKWSSAPYFWIEGGTKGRVVATLNNVPGWGDPKTYGRIELYSSGGQLLASQQTDTNSQTTFANVSAGAGYYCRGYSMHFPDPSPYGEQQWSRSAPFSVSAGATTTIVLPRNLPYCTAINIYANSADVYGGSVPLGTQLRIELGVLNPSLVGAEPQNVRSMISLDIDKGLPYDYSLTGTLTSISVGQEKALSISFTPTQAGAYYHLGAIQTDVSGSFAFTDGGTWNKTPLITVYDAGDKTAPPPPGNMTVTPSSWTNINAFTVGWVDPPDPSGIVAAWFRIGAIPTSGTDGNRVTGKPIVVAATAEDASYLHVWLEDGAGNKDHNNRASTVLYLDQTRPTGSLMINSGAPSTNVLVVALNLSGADQGGSGLASVRFSNDGVHWSNREPFQTIRYGWDLSQYGGNSGTGLKDVYAELADVAGNMSLILQDNIIYSTTSVAQIDGGIPGAFDLLPNYPNPFNPSTTIRFAVPKESKVRLEIFDLRGQSQKLIADENLSPGTYTCVWDARNAASGVYVCRMQANDFLKATKLILIR